MKDAGATVSEITSAMEKMAGGSSAMITQLGEYRSEQEALNAVCQQNVDITEDSIKSYAEFSTKMSNLETKVKGAIANGLTPAVNKVIEIWDWFEKDWGNTKFAKWWSKANNEIFDSELFGGEVMLVRKIPDENHRKNKPPKMPKKLLNND